MGEKWELIRNDPIVKDIERVIKRGIYKIDFDALTVLPQLMGDRSGPATLSTLRQGLIEFLMSADPDKSPVDQNLSVPTRFNLAIFRALPEMKEEDLKDIRRRAGEIYRPDNPVSESGVRKRPSAKKRSWGPEWQLILELREWVVRNAEARGIPLPSGAVTMASAPEEEADEAGLVAERRRHGARLDEAWALLDLCRSCATHRKDNLERLGELAAGLARDTNLNEARALVEFSAYESNRGLEKYRLDQGVRLLEAALSVHGGERTRRHALRLLLMREWAHLAVYGGLLESDRRETLNQIIDLGRESLGEADLDDATRQYMRVAVAEALKELSFVTHDAPRQKHLYEQARAECSDVVSDLEGEKGEVELRLVAHAKRHAAITFELQEDKERDDLMRQECLNEWSRLCMEGAELGEQVGDDYVRAYCLLNIGSVMSRQTRFEGTAQSKLELLAVGKNHLDEALPIVEALDDDRGRAWVYLHLCENTELRAVLEPREGTARLDLVRDLEYNAIQALNHLKHLDDPLGLTVAHLQLGKALCMMHEESEADAATMIRLDRAIDLLKRALEMTQKIGYYQEYPTAARWLARCLQHRWSALEQPSSKMLVEGINALITGICECLAGQEATGELEMLFDDLSGRLDDELRKRRAAG